MTRLSSPQVRAYLPWIRSRMTLGHNVTETVSKAPLGMIGSCSLVDDRNDKTELTVYLTKTQTHSIWVIFLFH